MFSSPIFKVSAIPPTYVVNDLGPLATPITALCVIFLMKFRWTKNKSLFGLCKFLS